MNTSVVGRAFAAGILKICCSVTVISLTLAGLSISYGSRTQIEVPAYAVSPHEVDDIFFLNHQHGWILLHDHRQELTALFRTNNGGKTWIKYKAPRGLGQIYFIRPDLGWAIRWIKFRGRYLAYLLRTRNGGTTWKQTMTKSLDARLAPDEFVVSMAMGDSKLGWFFSSGTGPAGSVLVTRDGGKSVQIAKTPNENRDYRGIFALPSGRVWILGSNDILSSSDQGKTWEQQFDGIQPAPRAIQTLLESGWFFPDGSGWVVGQEIDKGIIVATRDFGRHWQKTFESRESLELKSVYFSDEKNGCAVGLSESLVCTQDAGATWTDRKVLPPPKGNEANFFVKTAMLKSGRGFVLRAGGFLYETQDGGQTWHEFDPLSGVSKR